MEARRPRHLDSVDLMRVITVAGVIAVHVVAGTNRRTSVPAGAATILLHVNREVFVLLTALVLTYSYGFRETWSLRTFWTRRYWLVATPYVAWTVVYFLADGPPGGLVEALRQVGSDLVTGMARYHLYFLLVTMQLYLVFPALLVLVRAARRWHGPILAASLALQLAFTAALHYQLSAPGPLGWWFAHPDALLPSYQLSVLAGAIGAFRLPELADWVRRHGTLVAATLVCVTAAAIGSYLYDLKIRNQAPTTASQVFQPAVTVESLAVLLAMYALGVWWSDWRRPAWLTGAVVRASDASFGIYLAHPLVLQVLMALGGATGLLGLLMGLPARYTLAIDLVVVLPLVLVVTWMAVGLARRSPLSVPLAGRRAVTVPAAERPRRAWATDGLRTVAMAAALAGVVASLDLSSVRLASGGTLPSAPPAPDRVPALTATTAPTPPAGAVSDLETVEAGGLQRTYQVIRPVRPAATRLPAVVFLHGVNATIGGEEARDGLLTAAAAGQVVLVYPVGYGMSWDVGSCCGAAMDQGVDDMAFLSDVVDDVLAMPDVDTSRISLAGYSNGGKMAFRLSCARPGVFISLVIVDAVPVTPCASRPPISLLEFAARDDSELPYESSDGPRTVDGVRLTPVVTQVASWRQRDGCEVTPAVRTLGYLTTELWSSCRLGARVELATYGHGGHDWPYGDDDATPGAGQIMWTFLTQLNQPT